MNSFDDYLKSVEFAYSKTAGESWPTRGKKLMGSYTMLAALNQLDLLNKAKKKFSAKQIAELFWSTTQIRYLITGEFVIGLKISEREFKKPSLKKIATATEYLLSLLKLKTVEDPFCLNGKNNVLTQKEIQAVILSKELTSECLPEIKMLSISLASLSWAFGYDIHFSNFMEIYGPYSIGESQQLIIREFNFKEIKSVWKNAPSLPERVKIYLLYNNADIVNDWELHLESKSEFDLVKAKVILVEGGNDKIPSLDEIKDLVQRSNEATLQQVNYVNSLSILEKVRKGAMLSSLRTKGLADALNVDWKPGKEIEKVIVSKAESIWFGKSLPATKAYPAKYNWVASFDPRIPRD
ncbi:MAG: hypothetical protein WC652_03685 [archaeon]|jgi:hypothetical protein